MVQDGSETTRTIPETPRVGLMEDFSLLKNQVKRGSLSVSTRTWVHELFS